MEQRGPLEELTSERLRLLEKQQRIREKLDALAAQIQEHLNRTGQMMQQQQQQPQRKPPGQG